MIYNDDREHCASQPEDYDIYNCIYDYKADEISYLFDKYDPYDCVNHGPFRPGCPGGE